MKRGLWSRLEYIMDSPPPEHGGFHPETVETARLAHAALRKRLPLYLLASAAYCLLLWTAWVQEDESAGRVAQVQAELQAETARARALSAQVTALQAQIRAMPPPAYIVTATWYGHPYHGRPSASGERFDRHAYTIACNWLPMRSRVRLSSDIHSMVATVNDRMPTGTEPGRIDVSERIATEMGWLKQGVVTLKLEVLP